MLPSGQQWSSGSAWTTGGQWARGAQSQPMPELPTAPLLFDLYPAISGGAFLFKTRSAQTKGWGLRRVSDNAPLDVTWASDGWIDRQAVLDFAQGGDVCITTWYDPWNRGSAYDIKCTVAGNQAFIVKAGVLCTENDRPVADAGETTRDVYYSAPAIDTRQTNWMAMGWIGAGRTQNGYTQIPMAHRSDRSYGYGRLFAKLEAITTPSVSNVMSFQRTQDSGDSMTTHSTANSTDNLAFKCWTLEHSWTGGGILVRNGTTVASSGYVAHYTDIDQGGRNSVAGYYPFMGDGQSGGMSWRGTFGGGFYAISWLNVTTINAAIRAAWGY